tara:strand:- start:10 stop:570 length:561 start_codon:yes stop_codon:yes gene_type:complete
MTCRICLEDGDTISVCQCKGTQGFVHKECIQKWIDISQKDHCELCRAKFPNNMLVPKFNGIADPIVTMIVLVSLGCFFSAVSAYNISNETTHFPNDMVGTWFTITMCFSMHLFSWVVLNYYNHKVSILGASMWCMVFLGFSIVFQGEGVGFEFEAIKISYMFNILTACIAIIINVCCIHCRDGELL